MKELFETTSNAPSRKKASMGCGSSGARKNPQDRLPKNPEGDARGHFPSWLHRPLPKGSNIFETGDVINKHRLNTVCEEAKCPNRLECYSKKTATYLILGSECTRACGFCEIGFSKAPPAPDPEEPMHVAESSKILGLKHVVITMVARDDLPDGGAAHLVAVIQEVRRQIDDVTIEVLTSDFDGNFDAIDLVIEEAPELFNYNVETVRRLSPKVRHKATYDRTLKILQHVKKANTSRFVKSGLMVGFGESVDEVCETISDLHDVGVDIVTIGQYLKPSERKLAVKEFVTPESYKQFEAFGKSIGVKHVYAGPFVRSSYNADLIIKKLTKEEISR